MGLSITNIIEESSSIYVSKILPVLIDLFGNDFILYRLNKADYDDNESVYGAHSGTRDLSQKYSNIQIRLLPNSTLFSKRGVSNMSVLGDDPGYVFSKDEVKPGDIVKLIRKDNRTSYLRILDLEAIGTSIDIVYRFKLSVVNL